MINSKNAELEALGYHPWGDTDPYEDLLGPFLMKQEDDGTHSSAFWTCEKHANTSGALHGGFLMSFADFALFAIAKSDLNGGSAVTVGFNSEFVSAGQPGELIEAKGEVLRATRSLLFVRGAITSADRTIMTFSGILKRVKS